MNRRAIGYVRQSRRANQDIALSEDVQRGVIVKLAGRDDFAADDVLILTDLGRSGGEGKEKHRKAYQALLEEIEAGRVSHIYAISMTRLARSTVELYRLFALAKKHGITFTFDKEGVMNPNSAFGKAQFGLMSVMSEFERDLAVERAMDNHAERKAQGKRVGMTPYRESNPEDTETIVALFRETPVFQRVVRELNARGLRSRHGKAWTSTSLRMLLAVVAPDLLPVRAAKGAKPASATGFRFYRLLRCPHDGQLLTGSRYTKGGDPEGALYRCRLTDGDANHPRPARIIEARLVEGIEVELTHLRKMRDKVQADDDSGQRLAVLTARRRKVMDQYEMGQWDSDPAGYREKINDLDERIADVTSVSRANDVPAIPEDWMIASPATINRTLRAVFKWIELDPADLSFARAEWTVPEWRLATAEAVAG